MHSVSEDINAQPTRLRTLVQRLARSDGLLHDVSEHLRARSHVALIGMGASGAAIESGAARLRESGFAATAMSASQALYRFDALVSRSGVILASRTGESAEVVLLAQRLAERGAWFCVVTQQPESSAGRLASVLIDVGPDEDGVIAIGATTSIMLISILLAELTSYAPSFAASDVPGTLARSLADSREWVESVASATAELESLHVLWSGELEAAARVATLAFAEIARIPVVPIEMAEFRHGLGEVVDDQFAAIQLIPDGRQGELALLLGNDIRARGGQAWGVGPSQAVRREQSTSLLALPVVPSALASIVTVPVLQHLAVMAAAIRDLEPGRLRYTQPVVTSEDVTLAPVTR